MYLLAKRLPHTLVSDQNDEFKKLLAETEAKDIAAFAQAVGQQAKEIDGKVCAKKKVRKGNDNKEVEESGRWSCIDYTGTGSSSQHNQNMEPKMGKSLSWRFNDVTQNTPRQDVDADNNTAKTNRGWPSTDGKANDTSDNMAEDIRSKLNREQRNKVASLLSKTVSGAEVVEIRAVSTTSVMLNACCRQSQHMWQPLRRCRWDVSHVYSNSWPASVIRI